jgi:outer membrane protein assembly factor BamB
MASIIGPPSVLANDLAGFWSGPITHNGQTSSFAVSFEGAEDQSLNVRVYLPAIDVWGLPVGSTVLEGDSLRLGNWVVRYDADRQTLSGDLPAVLVPVHKIPFTLERTEELVRPIAPADSIPLVRPLWIEDTGGPVWAGVAHAYERVFAGSDDGNLYALAADDGRLIWKFQSQGPIRARPTLDGAYVYFHSDDGYLYKLNLANGDELWRAQLTETPYVRIPPSQQGSRYDHYASSAAIGNDIVYVGDADGVLHAFASDTGESLWRYRAGDAVSSTPAVYGDRVYFGSFDGKVYAVSADSGAVEWQHDSGAAIVSSPALAGGQVLIGSRSYDFFALDAMSGEPAWNYYLWFSWIESSAAIRDSVAYVGSSDAQVLTALDIKRGTPIWTTDTRGSAWAQPAVSDAHVFIGSVGVPDYIVDHQGGFLAVDRATGRIEWRYPSERRGEEPLWGFGSSPAVSDDKVFVGGLDGRIYAFPRNPDD